MKRAASAPLWVAAGLLSWANATNAAVTIGSGASVNFGDAAIGFGCSDLNVAGQASGTAANLGAIASLSIAAGGALSPGAGHIALGGNFSNAGTFAPGTGQVGIVDACSSGVSAVSGATSFHDLIVSTAGAKQLVLAAGMAQSVTHALTLQGAAGNLLRIVSSSAGQQSLLNVGAGATQTIAFVNARDNKATGAPIAPGAAAAYNSIDGGGLANWFADVVTNQAASVPAPMFSPWALLAMFGAMWTVAWRRRYR